MSYLKIENIRIDGDMWLGSNIRIRVLLETAATSVSITIEDPVNYDQVDQVAMTVVSDTDSRLWEYTYQSSEDDDEGYYNVFIRATDGTNISFKASYFILSDADDD